MTLPRGRNVHPPTRRKLGWVCVESARAAVCWDPGRCRYRMPKLALRSVLECSMAWDLSSTGPRGRPIEVSLHPWKVLRPGFLNACARVGGAVLGGKLAS